MIHQLILPSLLIEMLTVPLPTDKLIVPDALETPVIDVNNISVGPANVTLGDLGNERS